VKAGYEIKGSLVRAYVHQIENLGILPQVQSRVSAGTLKLLQDLPLPSTWLDAFVIEDMMNAVESIGGMDAVRAVTKGGQESGLMPLMRPLIAGLFRLFGTSPNTLLSRFSDFARSNVRGMEFEWIRESDRAGTLRIQFPHRNVPRSAFVGFESGMWIICEICSVSGKVAATEISRDGSTGFIRVSW